MLLVGVMVTGCGGYNDGPDYVIPDADIDAMIPCQAPAMYSPGALGVDVQEATDYPAEPNATEPTGHQIIFLANLTDADPIDVLYIELYEQFGAFAGTDIKTGTFMLIEDDAAYSSCGACVTIGAKVSDAGPEAYYSARGGTLTLTSVTGRLKGSLTDVMLSRVLTNEDGNPSDTPTYDCNTQIVSATFDTELLAPPP
jgi:hypothetical protein